VWIDKLIPYPGLVTLIMFSPATLYGINLYIYIYIYIYIYNHWCASRRRLLQKSKEAKMQCVLVERKRGKYINKHRRYPVCQIDIVMYNKQKPFGMSYKSLIWHAIFPKMQININDLHTFIYVCDIHKI